MSNKINWLKLQQEYDEAKQKVETYNRLSINDRSNFYDEFEEIEYIPIAWNLSDNNYTYVSNIQISPEWAEDIDRLEDLDNITLDTEIIENIAQPFYDSLPAPKNIQITEDNLWQQPVKLEILLKTNYGDVYHYANLVDLASDINDAFNGKPIIK